LHEDLPGGVLAVKAMASLDTNAEKRDGLYFSSTEAMAMRPVELTAIPYFANANRGPVDMAVWMPAES
jgi:DUF1680 family protein